jgi:streptogramin lyase
MTTRLLSLILISFCVINTYAQQSNDCDQNAGSQLTVNSTCTTTNFNSNNSTKYWDPGTGVATCTEDKKDDAWVWFIGTGQTTVITYTPTTNKVAEVTLFEGSACSTNMATNVACGKSATNRGTVTFSYTTTSGTIYHIRLQRDNGNGNMLGNICLVAVAGGNDDCGGAIALTVNPDDNCTAAITSTITGASASTQSTGCIGTEDDDVWFSFTATDTILSVNILNAQGSTTDMVH